jgi:uncharacterized protein (DUF1499 family)
MFYVIIPTLVVLLPILVLAVLSALATRPTNLGVRDGRLAPCPSSPNCVSTQADDDGHRMEPIAFTESPAEAMQWLESAVASIPRMKIAVATDDYLYAEASSLVFRFVDDVEFFIDKEAHVIHFRSASRVGRSDFGANRRRMKAVRQAFEWNEGKTGEFR